MTASLMLRKLGAYLHQNGLALRNLTVKWEEPSDRMGGRSGAIHDSVRQSIHPGWMTSQNGLHTNFLTLPERDFFHLLYRGRPRTGSRGSPLPF